MKKTNNQRETERPAANSYARRSSSPSQALEVTTTSVSILVTAPLDFSSQNHPEKPPQISDQQTLWYNKCLLLSHSWGGWFAMQQ